MPCHPHRRAAACYRPRPTIRPGTCYFGTYRASSISDPTGSYSLDRYEAAHAASSSQPVPPSDYLAYGHWFQRQAVPDVDRRKVIEVTRDPEWFSLSVQDGEHFRAKCVIVATGIAPIRLAFSAVLYASP
jgi:hypothetical protein